MSQIDIGKLRVISVDKWHRDAEHPECEICGISFTITRRRHHCRFCGKVVCDACSPISLYSDRICNLCLKCNEHSFSLPRQSFEILNKVAIGGTLKIKYNNNNKEDVFLLFNKIEIGTGKILYMLIYTTIYGSYFKYILFVEKGQNFVFFSIDDYTSPAKLFFSEENRSYKSKIPKEILNTVNTDSLLISNIIFENGEHQTILQGQIVEIGRIYKMYNIHDADRILEIDVLAIENRAEDENPVTKYMKKIKIKLVSISDNILPETFTVNGEYYLLTKIVNSTETKNSIRLIISTSGLTTDTSSDNTSDLQWCSLNPQIQVGGNKHRKNKNKKSKRVVKRYISKRYKNRRNKVTKRSKRSKKLRRR